MLSEVTKEEGEILHFIQDIQEISQKSILSFPKNGVSMVGRRGRATRSPPSSGLKNLRRIRPMNAYVASVIENVKKKHGNEPEFVQTVRRCSPPSPP